MTVRPLTVSVLSALSLFLTFSAACGAQAPTPQPARLLSVAEASERFGLTPKVQIREDGRRTPVNPSSFEWWYFEGHFTDGTAVIGWLGDNWPYDLHLRAVSLDITPPRGETFTVLRFFQAPGSFASERADVRIGPHHFAGNLQTYSIYIDPKETGGLGCDLTLHRRIPSYRPASGQIAMGESLFGWLVPVPGGEMTGTLTVNGQTRRVRGSGYHDHNWGNANPDTMFDRWWWGRARLGDRTLIIFDFQGRFEAGGLQTLFLGEDGRHLINAVGPAVSVSAGSFMPHPDGAHRQAIPSGLTFSTTTGARARFDMTGPMLRSVDATLLRRVGNAQPWYTRFKTPVTLTLPGRPAAAGEGTLEFMELR